MKENDRMKKSSLEFLKKLLTTPSPSGFEHRGQREWLDYASKYADETLTDTYGNAVAIANPGAERGVMIVGHADEIGLMVSHIDDSGFIYMKSIGGIDAAIVPGKRVSIHTKKGAIRGVTGATAIHLRDRSGDDKAPKLHECFLDIAAKDKDAVEKRGVRIGDPITFVDDFEMLDENYAVARALDNRIGTWIAAETLRLIKESKKKLNCTVYASSCVQEEIGSHGALMLAERLKPDMALVTDVGHATDSPGIDARKHGKFTLGGGPVLAIGGCTLREMNEHMETVAKKAKIDLQREASPARSGTDADEIFRTGGGVATALVSLPIRYMHTTVELTDLRDLQRIAEFFAEFCLSLKKGQTFAAKI